MRRIELIRKKDGNFIVFDWPNWRKYWVKYAADVKEIESMRQNYPELVVEDMIRYPMALMRFFPTSVSDEDMARCEEHYRDGIYRILLKRGVNKWLFVRKLLIRYKKWVQSEIRKLEREGDYKNDDYLRGKLDTLREVRKDLKTMCTMPRFVVWNYKEPGFIYSRKRLDGYYRFIKKIYRRLER